MAVTKTETVRRATTGDLIIRSVFAWRRLMRILYPSPAEVRFIRLMKGHVIIIPFVRSRPNKYPLAIVLSMGYLRRELVEREVWSGGNRWFCMDFATPHAAYRKCIEIDGEQYHDKRKDQERDDYLRALGWQVMRIPAKRLEKEPRTVLVEVMKFLKA